MLIDISLDCDYNVCFSILRKIVNIDDDDLTYFIDLFKNSNKLPVSAFVNIQVFNSIKDAAAKFINKSMFNLLDILNIDDSEWLDALKQNVFAIRLKENNSVIVLPFSNKKTLNLTFLDLKNIINK